MDTVRRRYAWLTAVIKYSSVKFLAGLDAESIRGFKKMYYMIISFGGLYLILYAKSIPEPIGNSLGHKAYVMWIILNAVCPIMSLLGQKLYSLAANKEMHEENRAISGAWMQLWGDFGVWMAITIYILCAADDFFLGQGLYAFFFVIMGFPGGFMFTARSVRRLLQIRSRERKMR